MTNPNAEHPIARRAAAIRLLAKCTPLGIRVWLRNGTLRATRDDKQPVADVWASRVREYKIEIAEIIGYHGQRRVYATEIVAGCRVYWLPQFANAVETSTDGQGTA